MRNVLLCSARRVSCLLVTVAPVPCWAAVTEAIAPIAPPDSTLVAEAVPASPPGDSGQIVVMGTSARSRADPLLQVNEKSFAAVQVADHLVVAPLSSAYQKVVPSPLRDGVHNVLYNLREPVVIANFLLQHRIGKAGRAFARLAINSTIGVGGLFDIARRKPFRIPFRRNGFANTLG